MLVPLVARILTPKLGRMQWLTYLLYITGLVYICTVLTGNQYFALPIFTMHNSACNWQLSRLEYNKYQIPIKIRYRNFSRWSSCERDFCMWVNTAPIFWLFMVEDEFMMHLFVNGSTCSEMGYCTRKWESIIFRDGPMSRSRIAFAAIPTYNYVRQWNFFS